MLVYWQQLSLGQPFWLFLYQFSSALLPWHKLAHGGLGCRRFWSCSLLICICSTRWSSSCRSGGSFIISNISNRSQLCQLHRWMFGFQVPETVIGKPSSNWNLCFAYSAFCCCLLFGIKISPDTAYFSSVIHPFFSAWSPASICVNLRICKWRLTLHSQSDKTIVSLLIK